MAIEVRGGVGRGEGERGAKSDQKSCIPAGGDEILGFGNLKGSK